jgi:hypothetical protein
MLLSSIKFFFYFTIEAPLLTELNLISGQVDLWTRKSIGCACSWHRDNEHDHARDSKHELTSDKNLTLHNGHHKHGHQLNCACCVKGGCQCGEQAPNRCSQCGLENHCLNSTLHCRNYKDN